MQTFKSYLKEEQLLTEADTSKATYMEMALCVAYNMKKGSPTPEAAAEIAGVGDETNTEKWGPLLKEAKDIIKDAGNWGGELVHSGSDSSIKSHANWPGTDSTSKADIRGNTSHMISLKKSGAPIMSAMGGGEAVGVFDFAIRHYGKIPEGKAESYYKAFKVLREDMEASIVRDSVVRAGAGKSDFVAWYVKSSSRATELKRKRIKFPNMITVTNKRTKKVTTKRGKSTNLVTHLKAELKMLGVPEKPSKATELQLHPEITPITKDQLAIYTKEYADTDEGSWSVGSGSKTTDDIRISAKHLKKIDKEDPARAVDTLAREAGITSDKMMKQQIQNVVDTSVASVEWKKALDNAFNGDDTFRSWIMYEAGSGYGKFTGKAKPDHDFTLETPNNAVANYMVVFDNGKIATQMPMHEYAKDNHSKVGKLDISYKSSGMTSYIKWGISSSYEHELPMIQEELTRLKAQYMLNEGIFKDMFTSAKNKMTALVDKVKKVIKLFWERIIKRFIDGLIDLFNQGLDKFAEALGITGTVTIGNA